MIREFTKEDLQQFEPNELSHPGDVMFVFEDDQWWLYTLERGGKIKAILAARETAPDEWAVFCLLSSHFNAWDSLALRQFVGRAAKILKPKKMWTISKPIERVNKWHRFFGLKFERLQEFQGNIYNLWAISL